MTESFRVFDDESPAKSLKSLQSNFLFGASRNLFSNYESPCKQLNFDKDSYHSKFSFNYETTQSALSPLKIIKGQSAELIKPLGRFSQIYQDIFEKTRESSQSQEKIEKNSQNTLTNNILWQRFFFDPKPKDDSVFPHVKRIYRDVKYAKHHLKQPSQASLEKKSVYLISAEENKKKALFFELENVLLCRHSEKQADLSFNVTSEKGESSKVFFKFRPYVLDSLTKLILYYDLYIFSRLNEELGLKLLKKIDPSQTIFSGAFFKNHCLKTAKGVYVKDLRIFNNKNLQDMIIVDKSVQSFSYQLDNGICIAPWENDYDCEMKFLTKFLIEISNVEDVREELRQKVGFSELG